MKSTLSFLYWVVLIIQFLYWILSTFVHVISVVGVLISKYPSYLPVLYLVIILNLYGWIYLFFENGNQKIHLIKIHRISEFLMLLGSFFSFAIWLAYFLYYEVFRSYFRDGLHISVLFLALLPFFSLSIILFNNFKKDKKP